MPAQLGNRPVQPSNFTKSDHSALQLYGRAVDSTTILRLSRLFLWGAIVWLPCLGYWAAQIRFGTPEVAAWLPGDDAARDTYRQFLDQFGDDQILFVSWPGCTLDDPRLQQLTARLQALIRTAPQCGITRVQDSREMLQHWLDAKSGHSLAEAQRELQGFAIGADGSCFIALHVDADVGERRTRLIESLWQLAQQVIAVEPSALILAGEPFQVYVIDQASRQTIERYVVPSSLLALLIAWLCLRSIRLTLLVFVLAGLGQLIGVALIALFFGEMSAVLVVLPTLVFMLTLSAAVHLTNYYRDVGGVGDAEAGVAALRMGAWPCILATLTTTFGFGSLLVSQLQPVWQFGSLAALGLCLATAMLLGLFPTAISLAAPRQTDNNRNHDHQRGGNAVRWLTHLTARHASSISGLGCLVLLLSIGGLLRLKTSTEFEDMFPPSSPAIKSLHWIQDHLGPINSLEFVISFPRHAESDQSSASASAGAGQTRDPASDMLAQARLVADIHADLVHSESVAAVLSAATFLPSLETGQGTRQTVRRAVLRRSLAVHRSDLEAQHLLAEQPESWNWRLSARIGNLSEDNYREIQTKLAALVQTRIDTYTRAWQSEQPSRDASWISSHKPTCAITGLRAVIEKAHFALLSDLGESFAMAFLLIVPVMMLIAGGVKAGLLLMLPNVLPVAVVFGGMGWLSIKLDVASILTASVALGIAVDDTLHFVTWFLRSRAQGLDATAAVRQAIAGCARAMLHTSIICTGSMLPFFFSDFIPTSKFALLMILILSGAIVGDLLLLPAILQSPLGRSIGHAKQSA